MSIDLLGIMVTVAVAQIAAVCAIWYKIGRLEKAADGYKMCPFYRGDKNPHKGK